MKKIHHWLNAAFGFSGKEVNGFLIINLILVLCITAPFLMSYFIENEQYNSVKDQKILNELLSNAEVFTDAVSENIPLEKKEYEKTQKIKAKKRPSAGLHFTEVETPMIEINHASPYDLELIKGVGPYWSKRILKYKKALGGFNNLEQLYEIYHIDSNLVDGMMKFISLDNTDRLLKININTASAEDLKMHPYLNYKIANLIVKYRGHHGNYKSIDDLMQIHLMTKERLDKVAPYLSL